MYSRFRILFFFFFFFFFFLFSEKKNKKKKIVGIPCILVGGGGYTIENVPRCWVNETAISLGVCDLPNDIPPNAKAYDLYKPDHKLFVSVTKLKKK